MRYFNTSGPCLPGLHYVLPPGLRLPDARELIDRRQYCTVYAPRRSGKTTTLTALAAELNAEGQHAALVFSCERARWTSDDFRAAEELLLEQIAAEAAVQGLARELQPPTPWPDAPPGSRLRAGLREWAKICPLPLVLFFDDLDALRGISLESVLAQLRSGYNARPSPFPRSVVLCGMRDVSNGRVVAGGDLDRLASLVPFNIVAEMVRLPDFTRDQIAELYGQHTANTGQEFQPDAVDCAFGYSRGQPWLANAIAHEIVAEMRVEPTTPVTAAHVTEAVERVIQARATHLDYLIARLAEPRVRSVIEPLIAGSFPVGANLAYDDVSYVRDLGLIAGRPPIQVANPIYQEAIVRVLVTGAQRVITPDPEGGQDMRSLG